MGVLSEGTVLSWNEIVSVSDVYRSYALAQLIRVFEKYKDQKGDSFQWGDEVYWNSISMRISLLLISEVGIRHGTFRSFKQTHAIITIRS